MDRLMCSSMSSEEIRITLLVEKFSMHVTKGYYASPGFRGQRSPADGGTEWYLDIHTDERTQYYDDYIDVRLRRCDNATEEQFVKAKLSILDFADKPALMHEKDLCFRTGHPDDAHQIMSVTSEQLFRLFGLNRYCLLPDDSLKLICDLTVYRYREEKFGRRKDFQNCRRSLQDRDVANHLVHCKAIHKTLDFVRRFEGFAMRSRSGRCVSSKYRSAFSGCNWNLVVYTNDDDFLDVRLRRRECKDQGLFVEAKVSVVDASGRDLLSRKQSVYFRGAEAEESRVLTVTEKDASGWFGSMKTTLIPDDTLTLHCKVTEYEGEVEDFTNEEDFTKSVQDCASGRVRVASSPIVRSLLTLVSVAVWLTPAFQQLAGFSARFLCLLLAVTWKSCVISYHFTREYIIPCVVYIVPCVLRFVLPWIVHAFKEIIKIFKPEKRHKQRQRNNSHYNSRLQDVVPYTPKQAMVPYKRQRNVVLVKRNKNNIQYYHYSDY